MKRKMCEICKWKWGCHLSLSGNWCPNYTAIPQSFFKRAYLLIGVFCGIWIGISVGYWIWG